MHIRLIANVCENTMSDVVVQLLAKHVDMIADALVTYEPDRSNPQESEDYVELVSMFCALQRMLGEDETSEP